MRSMEKQEAKSFVGCIQHPNKKSRYVPIKLDDFTGFNDSNPLQKLCSAWAQSSMVKKYLFKFWSIQGRICNEVSLKRIQYFVDQVTRYRHFNPSCRGDENIRCLGV